MNIFILLAVTFIALKLCSVGTGLAIFLSLLSLFIWPFVIPLVILTWGIIIGGIIFAFAFIGAGIDTVWTKLSRKR